MLPTTAGQPTFRCRSQPVASCVLSEAGRQEVVFYSFAPVAFAAKSETFRVLVKDPNSVAWDLSPDGSRIAWGVHEMRAASIQIRDLGRGETRDIPLLGWGGLVSLGWAADGRSLSTVRSCLLITASSARSKSIKMRKSSISSLCPT